jgi:hypothetical protein
MSFALLIIGAVLLTAAVRNTQDDLFHLVKGDFSGPSNFWYWLGVFIVLGAVGYIRPLKPISDTFLVLLIVVIFLSKGGFFAKFSAGIASTTTGGAGGPLNVSPVATSLTGLQGLGQPSAPVGQPQ